VEEIIELYKIIKENSYKRITYSIHICIENIIKKIDENNNPFEDELNFKYEFILELKKCSRNITLIIYMFIRNIMN
jgi:hypothetical protein